MSELFRVDLLKADAVKQVFTLDTSTFNDVHMYAGRVKLLLEASRLKNSAHEEPVLKSLYTGLPDECQKAITVKYPKVADLPNVTTFLDCARADNTQFPHRKTDRVKWFKARFKSIEITGQSATQAPFVKKPAIPQPNKGKHPRKEARQPCSKERCTSSTQAPAQCYLLHPELRPPFKKHKSSEQGHIRSVSVIQKAPAATELQSIHAKYSKDSLDPLDPAPDLNPP
ncbi:hypothetical protein EC968_000949 [Mortierella alpina]|nr:hypothetical protein EC968_000949 [Mortierella alpina]